MRHVSSNPVSENANPYPEDIEMHTCTTQRYFLTIWIFQHFFEQIHLTPRIQESLCPSGTKFDRKTTERQKLKKTEIIKRV